MKYLHYRHRLLEPVLAKALGSFPVVIVTGARQTGKTTLVQNIQGSKGRDYHSFDDLDTVERATNDPSAFVNESTRMSIEEIQRLPSIL